MRQTLPGNRLFAALLGLGLLAAFPSASFGGGATTQINVGGIDFKANDNPTSSVSGKIKSLPTTTGPTTPDPTNRLLDRSQGGNSLTGPSTTSGSASQGGEYTPGAPSDVGGRPTNPLCSQTNVTIGEQHQTTFHCPGGTLR